MDSDILVLFLQYRYGSDTFYKVDSTPTYAESGISSPSGPHLKDEAHQRMATVSVVGYGSLMDEASALATTPSLLNWRHGSVRGWVRCFDLVSIINVRRGLATGRELATCTARRREGGVLRVCCYDVPVAEYAGLLARERRLRVETVEFAADDGRVGSAQMFTRYSDAEYRAERATTPELWHEEVGQYYDGGAIYRDDLLPVPSYVERCVKAYTKLGHLENFLDHSFLGDSVTTIREYIASSGPIDLANGQPSNHELPVDIMRRATSALFASTSLAEAALNYGEDGGDTPFLEVLSLFLSRRYRAPVDRTSLVATGGVSHVRVV